MIDRPHSFKETPRSESCGIALAGLRSVFFSAKGGSIGERVFREEKKYLISLPEALQACHRLAQVRHETRTTA